MSYVYSSDIPYKKQVERILKLLSYAQNSRNVRIKL